MATAPESQTLLLGWGNDGRRDDGLGPAFARIFAERGLSRLTVSSDYQLQVEDAEAAQGPGTGFFCARVRHRCAPCRSRQRTAYPR